MKQFHANLFLHKISETFDCCTNASSTHSFQWITLLLVVLMTLAGCSPSPSKGQATPASDRHSSTDILTETRSTPSATTEAATETNTEAPEGVEIPAPLTDRKEAILQRMGYTVSYNEDWRIPNWVAWHLTSDRLTGPAQRKGIPFSPDTEAPGVQVDTHDYARSGYDRGHLCPAGDNKWSQQAMEESFLLTNICPQAPSLNRGDWNEMEIQCRKWAEQYGDIYIVAGPILYRGQHKHIGQHRVTVPEAFFKVVLCMKGKTKAIGFIYKNGDGNRPKGDYVNTVDEVERITGIDFFPSLPDDIEQRVETKADLDEWY